MSLPDSFMQQLQEDEFLKQRLAVTEKDYSEAVEELLNLALRDTSGSRVAAQVLLSCYNGHNYHMDLTDLCCLDYSYLERALIVIRGRVVLSKEPHDMIKNGSARFDALEAEWPHLHVNRRYKSD